MFDSNVARLVATGCFYMVSALPALAVPICPISGCEPDTTADCDDVCSPVTVGGKTIVVCNIDVTDEPEESDLDGGAIAIYDASDTSEELCVGIGGGPHDYCAWGKTTAGDAFYCAWGTYSDTLTEVHLIGGEGDDQLSFLCEEGPNPVYSEQMQEWSGYDLTALFIGRITAGPGEDDIIGSRRDSEDYEDKLNGEGGRDNFTSHEGNDYINGGDNADTVCAGPGDDGVFSAGGADLVCGEGGDDNLVAGNGNDHIHGGPTGDTDVGDGGPGVSDQCDVDVASNCEGTAPTVDCESLCP